MTRRLCCLAFLFAIGFFANPLHLAGQQPPALGKISGVVMTMEDPPRPLRRAIVSARRSDLQLGHHAITDDAGRFEIGDLPAGPYTLSATRPGFVSITYGATNPEWPGTQVSVAAGQHVSELTVRMAAGAAISGTVRDETGAPVVGLEVHIRRKMVSGSVFEKIEKTNAHGVYRAWGLAAGAYVVWLQPLTTFSATNFAANDSEVDALLAQLQQGRYGASRQQTSTQPVTRTSVAAFAPIYYPSAPNIDDATRIVVAAGEERNGIDIAVRSLPQLRLTGRVIERDGRPVTRGGVELVRASRESTSRTGANVKEDGTFEFLSVAPGRYQLVMWRSAAGPVGPDGPCEFAAVFVEVGSGDPRPTLSLKPCLKLAGHVELAGDATPAASQLSLTGAVIRLEPDRSRGEPLNAQIPILGRIGADSAFTIGGLMQLVPGSFLLQSTLPSTTPGTGLWLQSALTSDGRDILDSPLTFTDASPETTNVVLTFTDRHTSLSGQLLAASGRPAVDYTVIAVTTNRDWWRPPFRRVLATRPATDGSFLIHDLPPGEYFLAALSEVAPNEWLDPVFLERVAPQAVRLTIAPGEKKVQSLQIQR